MGRSKTNKNLEDSARRINNRLSRIENVALGIYTEQGHLRQRLGIGVPGISQRGEKSETAREQCLPSSRENNCRPRNRTQAHWQFTTRGPKIHFPGTLSEEATGRYVL